MVLITTECFTVYNLPVDSGDENDVLDYIKTNFDSLGLLKEWIEDMKDFDVETIQNVERLEDLNLNVCEEIKINELPKSELQSIIDRLYGDEEEMILDLIKERLNLE